MDKVYIYPLFVDLKQDTYYKLNYKGGIYMFVAYGVHWAMMYDRLNDFKEAVGVLPDSVEKALIACEYMTSLSRSYSVNGSILVKPPLHDFLAGIVYLKAQYLTYPNKQYLYVLSRVETEFSKYDVYSKLPLIIEPQQ